MTEDEVRDIYRSARMATRRLTGHDREDAIQEYVSERLAGAPHRTAVNRANKRHRLSKVWPNTSRGIMGVDFNREWADLGLQSVTQRQARAHDLERIVRVNLSLEQIAAVEMRYFQDMSNTEIARELGCSISKVDRLLVRAKAVIREALG